MEVKSLTNFEMSNSIRMIEKALQFTQQTFDQFLKLKFQLSEQVVLVNRIVETSGSSPTMNTNKVILSIIHIEQETNKQFYSKDVPTRTGNYINAPVSERYNIYLLVVPNFDDYNEGLKFLNASIQFFQANGLLDASSSSNIPEGLQRLEFELEKSEDYMQMQNLWTALGAKYKPSVIYKMRLITIHSDQIDGFDSQILKVENGLEIT